MTDLPSGDMRAWIVDAVAQGITERVDLLAYVMRRADDTGSVVYGLDHYHPMADAALAALALMGTEPGASGSKIWDLIERTANEARNWDAALTDDQATAVEAFALHLLATRETEESTCCPTCGSDERSKFLHPCKKADYTANEWHIGQPTSSREPGIYPEDEDLWEARRP